MFTGGTTDFHWGSVMSFRLGTLSVLLPFVFSCSKGSQTASSGGDVSLKIASTACLDGMGAKFQNFFNGTGSNTDIHSVWACMSNVLQDFTTFTFGATPGQYSVPELKGFLVKYYFPGGLSDAAVTSTMQLKKILVGGSTDVVSKGEIVLLQQVLANLDAVTSALAPATPTLFNSANNSGSDAAWMQSYQNLNAQAPQIAKILSQSGQICTLTDIQTLIDAWADQFNLPGDSFFRQIASLIPSLGAAKAILIGGSSASLQPAEWNTLLISVASAYSYYRMAVRLTNMPSEVSMSLQSPNVQWAVGGIVGLLNQAVQARPNNQIPLAEISSLLNSLNSLGDFPSSFTPTEAMSALQFMITKLFAPSQGSATAFDSYHVAAMQQLVSRWQTVEQAVEQGNFANLPYLDKSLHPGWALPLDSVGRLQIPPVSSATVFREYSIIYTLIEWIGEQWGTWPLSQANFQNVVTDGLTLIHSFGWLSGTANSVYLRLLREANLFLPSSNGDMLLDLPEAFQYALYALSSYRGSHAFEQLVGQQCATTDYTCFQNLLFQNRQAMFANFPNLVNWLNANPGDWAAFAQDLSKTAGQGEWLMQFQVVHYVETFMQRWDTDPHDQLIEMNEALNAYSVYGPVLTQMLEADGISADDIEPIYTFLFAYGETPESLSFGGSVQYLYWKWHPSSWKAAADRKTLADILAALSVL